MTATAGYDVPARRLRADTSRPDVVVRLHPEPLRPRSGFEVSRGRSATSTATSTATDLDGLTRAVHALVEALAPGMTAEVCVVDPTGASAQIAGPGGAADPKPEVLGDERIRLDRRSRTLLVDGDPVPLTKREFELLAHLVLYRGAAMSRRELMNAVWHERYLPGDRTVDVHVRRVRVKLGRHADRLTTLRGFGYRFD